MPYTDDENGNNSYTVEYKESSSGTTDGNTGDETNAPSDDIENNSRPTDIGVKGDGYNDYDKGAYEYVP